MNSSEILLTVSGYNIFRDDCVTSKGGDVLLAVSKCLSCEEQPDLKSDSNISWVKITIKGVRSIYVSSFHKSRVNDETSLSELSESVKRIPKTVTFGFLLILTCLSLTGQMKTKKDHVSFKPCMMTSWKT